MNLCLKKKKNKQMTLWGYQVDLDVYVYSNVYVTLIHVKKIIINGNCV